MLGLIVPLAATFMFVSVPPAGAIGPGAQRVTDVPGSPYRPGENVVALTFDDGPDPLTTPRVLDILAAKGAKATFFVLGVQAARYPDLIRRIAREGHVVAGHTWSHVRLTGLSEAAFRKEVDQTNGLLTSLTGQKVRCVRPPEGVSSAAVVDRLRVRGLTTMQWTSDPRDWTRPGVAAIEQRVLGSLRPGGVVVMHDWRGAAQTPAALPGILDGIAARGYRAVSICGDGPTGPVRPAIFAFGSASFITTGDLVSRAPLAAVAAGSAGSGLRLMAADGGVFSLGGASFNGSAPSLESPVVASASTPSGSGYWLVRDNGDVTAFGDARFEGSPSTILQKPVVGMAAGRSGGGYWLVAADGGVFAFGGAPFLGSTGGIPLRAPIVAMAATPSRNGYWLLAADGGVFAFGDAPFLGSTGGISLRAPIVAMAGTPSGQGYWLLGKDGGVFAFGDAPFRGAVSLPAQQSAVGMASEPSGTGYWVVTERPA